MYLTKQLTLFKTPLSPTYENVYDDYSTYIDYENFLLNNFQHIEIEIVDEMDVGRDKSVIDKNGIFSLVINNYSSMDIHDYNYCCFETDKTTSKPLFAFILSVDSLNDSRTSPSCRINCQLDAWTHNIFDMQSGYDVNFTECRHMIESEEDGGSLKALPFITTEGDLIVECKGEAQLPRLLWARITVGNEIKCVRAFDTLTLESAADCGAYPLSETTPVFFIPMFVCVPLTGEIKYEYRTAVDSANGLIRILCDSEKVNGLLTSGTELISVELTYYAPYDYILSGDKVIISAVHTIPESNGNVYTLYDKVGSPLFSQSRIFATETRTLGKQVNYANKKYENNLIIYQKYFPSSLGNLNDEGYYDDLIGRLLYYPYSYESFTFNQKEIRAIPELDRKYLRAYIDFQDTPKPIVKIYQEHNDGTIEYVDFETANGNGEVVTTIDSYEYFKRNNGNKILIGAILSVFGSTKTVPNMTHTVGRFPDGSTTLLNSAYQEGDAKVLSAGKIAGAMGLAMATVADADNKFDDYKIPQSDAYDNPFMQDFIGKKRYSYILSLDSQKLKRKLHNFGININKYLSVREKTHYTFDYVRTNNCRLPMIGNIDDRREIETAYDRGITKWHISGNATDVYMRTFSKNIPNMDLVQQEYYSVG